MKKFVVAITLVLLVVSASADLFDDDLFEGCDPLVSDCFQQEERGISGRVLLISHATKWIGPAIAQYFAGRGVKLVLFDNESSADRLRAIVDVVGQDRAVWHSGALASEAEQAAAFQLAEQAFDEPVSLVLINTERTHTGDEEVKDPADVDLALLTTPYSQVYLSSLLTLRQAVSSFRRNDTPKPTVVFLSSILSLASRPDRRHLAETASGRILSHGYLPAMAALNSLAHSASMTYAPEGIRVYNLLPGSYRTDPNDADAALHLPENPIFPDSYGSPDQLALIIEQVFAGLHSFLPGKMILTDHDATFSASLWLESTEQDTGRHMLFADQVLDASGSHYYDFSKRPSAYVRSGRSADKMMELISLLLEQEAGQ